MCNKPTKLTKLEECGIICTYKLREKCLELLIIAPLSDKEREYEITNELLGQRNS